MKKYVPIIIIAILLLWILLGKINYSGLSKDFIAKQDSLVAAVDSMKADIEEKNVLIDSLEFVDANLQYQLETQKTKVITVYKEIDDSKSKIDTYSEVELVNSFNNRYPKDTITNPLPIAQPVLISAAKDLVELDGSKKIIVIKDSIISLNESRIAGKDSVISLYSLKENSYKGIITNQEIQIGDWKDQYKKSQIQNKKLKLQAKLGKLGTLIALGGMGFFLVK
jgi:hypothetical protein